MIIWPDLPAVLPTKLYVLIEMNTFQQWPFWHVLLSFMIFISLFCMGTQFLWDGSQVLAMPLLQVSRHSPAVCELHIAEFTAEGFPNF